MLRTYRRASGGKRKAQANASMGFLQQLMHYVDPASARKKHAQNWSQSTLKPCPGLPKSLKIELGSVHERHDAPKSAPRASKRCPGTPKRRPRDAQGAPRSGQKTPRTRPKDTQTPPKSCPGSLKGAFACDLCKETCSNSPQTDFF